MKEIIKYLEEINFNLDCGRVFSDKIVFESKQPFDEFWKEIDEISSILKSLERIPNYSFSCNKIYALRAGLWKFVGKDWIFFFEHKADKIVQKIIKEVWNMKLDKFYTEGFTFYLLKKLFFFTKDRDYLDKKIEWKK